MAKDQDLGDDFSYMLRMADTDIDGLKPLGTALTAVRGIGDRTASMICGITGFDPGMKAGHLDVTQQETLRQAIGDYSQNVEVWMLNRQHDLESGDELHLVGQDLKLTNEDDISRLRSIKCYRGIRHAGGHKVRGQRGRSNGRFGLTLGVQRKK